jgi:hypothetical protein
MERGIMRVEHIRFVAAIGIAAVALCSSFGSPASAEESKTAPAGKAADSSMVLKGSEEGTVFKSLTIEGEDRVRIEFERPSLSIDLDPLTAPGLDWESTNAVLGRCDIDFLSPLVALSAVERSPYLARPWLESFATGDIVRFRPALTDVERWRLTIADSRSRTIAEFEGKGSPPKELGWNGRATDGNPMPPGLTYSYVVEAYDRAGNKRNFVGKGFEIPSYELDTAKELVLLFSGQGLSEAPSSRRSDEALPPPLLLDAASRINQAGRPDGVIRVAVTARSYKEADALAKRIGASIEPLVLGDPSRIQYAADVQPDAPAGGTVAIRVAR